MLQPNTASTRFSTTGSCFTPEAEGQASMPKKDTPTGAISAQAQQDLVSDGIENFELPKSVVTKIAKSAVSFPISGILSTFL